ncbi:hypothetical protein CPB83DRAFT_908495 [Crepidotus variabilis]|uniref:Uncharacterized protein n=1 Tax=Crepidotus variabilis TaxID=179855 RepID=A0A9P6JMR5_9AGAR|nr:hypothetical protein CPB83DRAFT_908495 [Crepidotus variabilis]
MAFNYAEDVAPEIWQRCWIFVERDCLPALTLTCRLFNDICKPMLFEQLEFSLPRPYSRGFQYSTPKANSIEMRFENVSSNDKFNKLVRSLTFVAHSKARSRPLDTPPELSEEAMLRIALEAYETLLMTISSSISRFCLLQQVSVGPVPLGPQFMRNLRLLGHLNQVHIDSTAGVISPQGTAPLRVGEFSYEELEVYHTFNPPTIMIPPLIVVTEHLQRMSLSGAQANTILTSFIRHGSIFRKLRYLSFQVNPSHISSFFDFLLICPILETLRIINYRELADILSTDLPAVSAAAAPRLANYLGPDSIAVALAPGRPISKTVLVNTVSHVSGLTAADIASLGCSSTPIVVLSLGLRFMNRAAFHNLSIYLPQLQKFTVHIYEVNSQGYMLEDAIPYLDLLSELEMNTVPLPRSIQILGLGQQRRFEPYTYRGIRPTHTLIPEPFPIEQQEMFLVTLSSLYPELREASLGMRRVDWRKHTSQEGEKGIWAQAEVPDMFPLYDKSGFATL